MSKSKTELNDLFHVVIGFLRNKPLTIVMDNQGSTRGQIYTIAKATHEQAGVGRCQSNLFKGTAKETIIYLQGMRDLFTDILANEVN